MPVLERPDSARIWWEAEGPEDGQAVLLIMGLGYPAAMWFRQLPALTERYRVIRLDNRGAGHTGDVPERRTPSRRWPRTALPCSTRRR